METITVVDKEGQVFYITGMEIPDGSSLEEFLPGYSKATKAQIAAHEKRIAEAEVKALSDPDANRKAFAALLRRHAGSKLTAQYIGILEAWTAHLDPGESIKIDFPRGMGLKKVLGIKPDSGQLLDLLAVAAKTPYIIRGNTLVAPDIGALK